MEGLGERVGAHRGPMTGGGVEREDMAHEDPMIGEG